MQHFGKCFCRLLPFKAVWLCLMSFLYCQLHACTVWRVLCLCVFLGWTYFDLQHWRCRDGVAGPEVYLSAAQYRLPARHPDHYPHATFVPAYCRAAQAGRKHGPPDHSPAPSTHPSLPDSRPSPAPPQNKLYQSHLLLKAFAGLAFLDANTPHNRYWLNVSLT